MQVDVDFKNSILFATNNQKNELNIFDQAGNMLKSFSLSYSCAVSTFSNGNFIFAGYEKIFYVYNSKFEFPFQFGENLNEIEFSDFCWRYLAVDLFDRIYFTDCNTNRMNFLSQEGIPISFIDHFNASGVSVSSSSVFIFNFFIFLFFWKFFYINKIAIAGCAGNIVSIYDLI